MTALIDASGFPTGSPDITYVDEEDVVGLAELQAIARAHVMSFGSPPPIAEMVLAFGLAPIVAVFLARFVTPLARGELAGATEMWAVAGDLPPMCFETDDAPTPADALRLYRAIAQDWADSVLAGADLAECYPIEMEPTEAHAWMLLSRIEHLREVFVPMA
jgi:hypothetical protein